MEKAGKVWGETSCIVRNPIVEMHRIEIKAGFKCSKHTHVHKWNGFYVESGSLEIHVWKNDYDLIDITVLRAGDYCAVKPGEYHQFVCKQTCVAFELYWPEMLTEDIKRVDIGCNL